MLADNEYLLKLLSSTINRRPAPLPDFSVNWDLLLNEAIEQNIASIIYSTVAALPPSHGPQSGMLESWKAYTQVIAFKQMAVLTNLTAVLTKSESAGFFPVVVKGPLLSSLYPEPLTRGSTDIDLLIDIKDEPALFDIFRELGCFESGVPADDVHEHTYTMHNNVVYEVHRRLWEERLNSPRHKTLIEMNLTEPEDFIHESLLGINLTALGCYQQFIHLLYHMVRHFVITGMGVRHLTDLTLFYNAHKDDVDTSRLWCDLDKLGYTSFCKIIFAICIKYFDMEPAIYPDYQPVSAEVESGIMADIWSGGIFGKRTTARELSGRFLRQCYESEDKPLPKSRIGFYFSILFPSASVLDRIDDKDLSKNKPVAWFQRTAHLISRWRYRKSGKLPYCSLKDRMDCAMKRVSLLKQIDLLR